MRFRYSIRLSASLGELALAQGDLDQARRHAERCLELAARTNARKNLVKGWRLAGEVACAARRWDDAEHALGEARAIAEAIGNPTQLWRTYAALARFHAEQRRQGRRAPRRRRRRPRGGRRAGRVGGPRACGRASKGWRSCASFVLELAVNDSSSDPIDPLRLIDVLDQALAQIVEAQGRRILELVVGRAGQADAAR